MQRGRSNADSLPGKGERPNSSPTRLVYIMGRGHSGSTVLDALLGNGKDIESIGELVSGIDRFDSLCACGVPFRNCQFWKRVRSEFEPRSGLSWELGATLVKNQAYVGRFVRTLLSRLVSSETRELYKINTAIVDSILSVAGKKCVVDSSKEPTRGLFLARFVPYARIVHLVRHPAGILASNLYRLEDGTGFKYLRHTYRDKRLAPFFLALSSVSWLAGNLLAEIIRRLAPSRVLRVRYEDLCTNPRGELQRLSSFIGYDLGPVVEAVERQQSLRIGHNIGGNRMRMGGNFLFDPQAGSRRHLPWLYGVMARVIAWPLMLPYGYKPFPWQ